MEGLLQHLVPTIAVLDHAEGLGVLAPFISSSLRHRLRCLPVTLASNGRDSCKLVLSHQSVELLRYNCRIVQIGSTTSQIVLHSLEIRVNPELAQIHGLVAALLRCATCHGEALGERHRSHVLSTCRIVICKVSR